MSEGTLDLMRYPLEIRVYPDDSQRGVRLVFNSNSEKREAVRMSVDEIVKYAIKHGQAKTGEDAISRDIEKNAGSGKVIYKECNAVRKLEAGAPVSNLLEKIVEDEDNHIYIGCGIRVYQEGQNIQGG